jgi:hypothetical protein
MSGAPPIGRGAKLAALKAEIERKKLGTGSYYFHNDYRLYLA